ncbi:hypothetical protein, conserved [Angomonas deanei]|uniref:Uncharacterized protein n=1 Tax=Angomonas deanei TaxID=59799 RepID=A0A7G2C7L7_9TRYP|nr:hypothetical protein, conserved [Angomonas deanei]
MDEFDPLENAWENRKGCDLCTYPYVLCVTDARGNRKVSFQLSGLGLKDKKFPKVESEEIIGIDASGNKELSVDMGKFHEKMEYIDVSHTKASGTIDCKKFISLKVLKLKGTKNVELNNCNNLDYLSNAAVTTNTLFSLISVFMCIAMFLVA